MHTFAIEWHYKIIERIPKVTNGIESEMYMNHLKTCGRLANNSQVIK
jgi:hypothetical protein